MLIFDQSQLRLFFFSQTSFYSFSSQMINTQTYGNENITYNAKKIKKIIITATTKQQQQQQQQKLNEMGRKG